MNDESRLWAGWFRVRILEEIFLFSVCRTYSPSNKNVVLSRG
jgi:hypothetical protein